MFINDLLWTHKDMNDLYMRKGSRKPNECARCEKTVPRYETTCVGCNAALTRSIYNYYIPGFVFQVKSINDLV